MSVFIFLITDYKGIFGSKYNAIPYRSGFDKKLLTELFRSNCYEPVFLSPSTINMADKRIRNSAVVYTSQEDNGLFYKSYLEDLIYSLELSGTRVIPSFSLFRAHENKVFFEMLRKTSQVPEINNLNSFCFGAFEEYELLSQEIVFPCILKSYNGSKSRGVFLIRSKKEASLLIKKMTKTNDIFLNSWDYLRSLKYNGYKRESWNRKKFIIQEFVPGLINDYKVIVFGSKYYVLRRENKIGDFRASGQGRLSFIKDIPKGLLEFSEKCHKTFNSPHSSFDIGFNGNNFFLFEAQFIYFGTYTLEYSNFYFKKENNDWSCIDGKSCLEEEYVTSIIEYISK